MTRKKASDWEDLITEAACSGIDIPEFCSLHGFSRSWFYRMARRLGYMDGGKRTEKWEAAASGACAVCMFTSGASCGASAVCTTGALAVTGTSSRTGALSAYTGLAAGSAGALPAYTGLSTGSSAGAGFGPVWVRCERPML